MKVFAFDFSGTLAKNKRKIISDKNIDPISLRKKHMISKVWKFAKKMHNKGHKIGIITNTSLSHAMFKNILKKLNIDDYFSFVLTSCPKDCPVCHGTYRKPHSSMFLNVKKMFPGSNSFTMVGNSIFYDITPAKKAGFKTIFVKKNGGLQT